MHSLLRFKSDEFQSSHRDNICLCKSKCEIGNDNRYIDLYTIHAICAFVMVNDLCWYAWLKCCLLHRREEHQQQLEFFLWNGSIKRTNVTPFGHIQQKSLPCWMVWVLGLNTTFHISICAPKSNLADDDRSFCGCCFLQRIIIKKSSFNNWFSIKTWQECHSFAINLKANKTKVDQSVKCAKGMCRNCIRSIEMTAMNMDKIEKISQKMWNKRGEREKKRERRHCTFIWIAQSFRQGRFAFSSTWFHLGIAEITRSTNFFCITSQFFEHTYVQMKFVRLCFSLFHFLFFVSITSVNECNGKWSIGVNKKNALHQIRTKGRNTRRKKWQMNEQMIKI